VNVSYCRRSLGKVLYVLQERTFCSVFLSAHPHGHQWKHCAWNKRSDGSASRFGNPKGNTIAQDLGETRIKPCMARPVKHEQSFRHQVIGPDRVMQVKDATSGRNACISGSAKHGS
jgi:hypothetical protein